uniref:SAC domain-containing protein n=2 Tax=Brassica oleracea var. oleracea TaxID=109376 RepID=A0A0D3DWU4_BRAOL
MIQGLKVKLLAQYANGLVVLDHQLHLLGIRGPPVVDTNNPLAEKLMEAYEKMGHVIAMQYAGSDAHTKMFSDLRGDWNMMMKHRDMLTAVHRYYNNAYQDSEKQDAINVFLGKFKPQLGRPALLELRSDQRNTKSSNPNLEIENLRSKLTRSFSDNLLLEDLDSKKLVLENPQPSREGLNGGWETTSEFGFYEEDSSSPSVHSAIRDEDHFRGTESRQMYPGSSSTSDSRWLDDVPGFSHSYSAKFTTAEEMFERRSSMSSDNMFSDMYKSFTSTTGTDHPSDPDQPADGIVLVPGFSIYFIQWVEHGRALERVRR